MKIQAHTGDIDFLPEKLYYYKVSWLFTARHQTGQYFFRRESRKDL